MVCLIMIVFARFNFITAESAVDAEQIKAKQTGNHSLQWSQVIGGIFLVGGITIAFRDNKKKTKEVANKESEQNQ